MPKQLEKIRKPVARGTRLRFQQAIAKQLSRYLEHCDEDELISWIELPRSTKHGQFALPLPRVSRNVGHQRPADLCRELAQKFKADTMIERVTPVGLFLNFAVCQEEYIRQTLVQVYAEKDRYGWAHVTNKATRVLLDYSSPNIAKPFHAGHLRSTLLGNFVKRIHEVMGYTVVSVNYLGDWGKQYGLLAVGYEKFGDPILLEKDPIRHLYEVYVRVHEESRNNPEIDALADDYFRRMEEGDEEALKLWWLFREQSIQSYSEIYRRLDVTFDEYSGESQVSEYIPKVYEMLQQQNLVTISNDGAWSVNLEQYKLGKPCVRRANGTSLYLTRDLASILMRKDKFQFDKVFYVVGAEHKYYFKQLFKIYELMFGEEESSESLQHVRFGRVYGMSTRKGNAVFLQDILDTAKEKILEVMQGNPEKYEDILQNGIANTHKDVQNKQRIVGEQAANYVADRLGTSAVIVQDMASRRIKDYTFAWERITDTHGDTGVFLQYTHARIWGIETKAEVEVSDDVDFSALREKEAFDLAQAISLFPEVVHSAFESLEPCTVLSYLFKLARIVSQANYVLRVKDMDPRLAKARMLLFWAARITLGNGMRLIGIEPLEKM